MLDLFRCFLKKPIGGLPCARVRMLIILCGSVHTLRIVVSLRLSRPVCLALKVLLRVVCKKMPSDCVGGLGQSGVNLFLQL